MAEPPLPDVRDWAARAWPSHDWAHARLAHGAFHRIAVLEQTVVARVAFGDDAIERTAREVRTLHVVAALGLPVTTPRPLGEIVTSGGAAGILTTFVPGVASDAPWPRVREPLAALLERLRATAPPDVGLSPPRAWCGGSSWPRIVADYLAPQLPTAVAAEAVALTERVVAVEAGVPPAFVHGDFGMHNLLWSGRSVTGMIDLDHAAWADPAIDVAPLIGQFGAAQVAEIAEPAVLSRAMHHRATLSLQVAAAAQLAGDTELRDFALGNFARRVADGTSHDPGGMRPRD
ncbi:aminoglycoside phosphotransferase family protein [Occultella glacieicola]|uniref:Aminoglycoside phosphotransferase family protein n=1 Tax=Occultella glacieicola TaxID=2518684 RepID=A0ABY2DXG4_9MICO|nr:aminoglycoside phosphotransferase family protein [Occultella glacieicola]TDE88810.1 aminoglycoside phosphotransferase family protein [Occultella glacieicola]